jgi:tetratricopeptide (TPR) repeat protein
MYTYEGSKNKDSVILNEVIKNFEIVIVNSDDAMYLNYYGYLLIDHDIDVIKGIELVEKALEKESDSLYYLDSLAWGYYKTDRCDEAFEIMKDVYEKDQKESEIAEHYEKIKECVDRRKK